MRFLSDSGIPFTARDVAKDAGAIEELLAWTGGVRGTPVIVVDGQVLRGFDRGKLSRLLGLG
jgi:glutaredoxin